MVKLGVAVSPPLVRRAECVGSAPRLMNDPSTRPAERRASCRLAPTVLLVEDEAALRRVLARQLQAGGYRVIPAASGREALAILTEQAATIDLLLTDVMMHESPADCLAKPFTDTELRGALEAVLPQ